MTQTLMRTRHSLESIRYCACTYTAPAPIFIVSVLCRMLSINFSIMTVTHWATQKILQGAIQWSAVRRTLSRRKKAPRLDVPLLQCTPC